MSPVLSVIIPVYNVELYLDECIESVLTQTFKDIEVILIDDGSTDSSGQKCDAWANKDCRVKVYHKSNGGLSSARNIGLNRCNGEYVMFLDSDDKWGTIDIAEKLISLISVDKCIDLIQFKVSKCSETGIISDLRPKYEDRLIVGQQNIEIAFFNGEIGPTVWDMIYRKSSIPSDVRFIEGVYYEDECFLISLLPYLNYIRLSTVGSYFNRIRKGSITQQSFSMKHAVDLFKKDFYGMVYTKKRPYLEERYLRYYSTSIHEYINVLLSSNDELLCEYSALLQEMAPSWSQLIGNKGLIPTKRKVLIGAIKLLGVNCLNRLLKLKSKRRHGNY